MKKLALFLLGSSFLLPAISSAQQADQLYKQNKLSNPHVINKIITTLKCVKKHEVEHNSIITIIDYSLPSSQKRLWVFDLAKNKLLFHTYVSHGIKSGVTTPRYFSNIINSKASSVGVFTTEKAYYGRHGIALKLHGLDKNFNDNSYQRFIVMHSSWYVNEEFIKKYGRAGRSWGCPTLPHKFGKPIINTIKNNSLLIVYYPHEQWLVKSKFLNCKDMVNPTSVTVSLNATSPLQLTKNRGPILFADLNNNDKREQNEPIVAISADAYQQLFKKNPPLNRMLRRQVNQLEYISVNNQELKYLIKINYPVKFMIPVIKMKRGFYATEMKMISIGKIKRFKVTIDSTLIYFQKKPTVTLKPTKRFIRWLGL